MFTEKLITFGILGFIILILIGVSIISRSKSLGWFSKKEPLRKVRLLEFEKFLKEYSDTIDSIQTLSLKSIVLIDGLTYYAEGHMDNLTQVDIVGYLKDVEFLRVKFDRPRLETLVKDNFKPLQELRERYKFRRLDPYIRYSFIEGKDYYSFEELRTNVRSSDTIKVDDRTFKTLGLPADLHVEDSELTLELTAYYPNPTPIRSDVMITVDSKFYALGNMFLKDEEGNYVPSKES